MILIFEGCDGAGKTTAVQVMEKILKEQGEYVTIMHRGVPLRDPLVEYTYDLEPLGHTSRLWTLCDRWHMGEAVYGPIYRGGTLLSIHGYKAVEEFLARRGAVLLYFEAPISELQRRVKDRGDDYVKVEDISTIVVKYQALMREPSPLTRFTYYNFTEQDAHHIIETAKFVATSLTKDKG